MNEMIEATVDPASLAILHDLVRREGRSLLQYVSESFPWTTPDERAALLEFQKIVDEDLEGAARIARFLNRHKVRTGGPLGPFPMAFTNINYMSLEHLLPILQDNQRRRIDELTADLKKVADPECRRHLEAFIDLKRRHLARLESMLRPLAS
ncbi:MAG: hypothetical protein FJ271_08260 [Planctomycetes bacterium]|nr:hypothetical protein [Planctomycetota bacterium]